MRDWLRQLVHEKLFGASLYSFDCAIPLFRGSAIAKIVGKNIMQHPEFDQELRMWVFEETVDGRLLTDIINTEHENVKYLPNIKLPHNVVAVPELMNAVDGATLLVFVIPHQVSWVGCFRLKEFGFNHGVVKFVKGVCEKLRGKIHTNARAISLIKVKEGPQLRRDGGRLFFKSDVLFRSRVHNRSAYV